MCSKRSKTSQNTADIGVIAWHFQECITLGEDSVEQRKLCIGGVHSYWGPGFLQCNFQPPEFSR